MNLKVTKPKYISKEGLDSFIETYQKGMMTYETFIDVLISSQKRLVIQDLCGPGGGVEGEILLRRMSNSGIDIVL